MALTDTAHTLIKQHLAQPDVAKKLAIDATCGNGFDSEFLCSIGFEHVLAFDIQQRALAITRHLLETKGYSNATLLCKSHDQIEAEVLSRGQLIDCAMFNLGYLPHGDKTITTRAESSLLAISQTMNNLSPKGIITVLCYPGHPNGALERDQLQAKFADLDAPWSVAIHRSKAESQSTPVLYVVRKHPNN